ncbi:antitoxin MazE-like protein [Mongoliimonas terrestris]|uniref:antitoxin MazE-like protein n=1 Tax=Mongoliimonas terrestris TaxID=1709001 RepID=UPI0009496877|nr:antitoxin MazE-like protein [Mongoliimonas terrestris]
MSSAAERARRYRSRRRQEGWREVRLWLPDTTSPAFQAECRRQARLLREDPLEARNAAWAEAAASSLDLDA